MKMILVAALALAIAGPPSGRPPMGSLERFEPLVYDLKYEIGIGTLIPLNAGHRYTFNLRDTPIVMPLIFQGAFSKIQPDSIRAQLWLDSSEDRALKDRFRIDEGLPHHTHLAVIPVPRFSGQSLRWNITYRVQSWSSRIDDSLAAEIAWPREWPKEVLDGLQPQLFIESNDPIFKQAVETVSQGNLRMVPPYLAAKDLVRYCVNEIQPNGDALNRGENGVLRGLNLGGAKQAASNSRGSPNDLVCVSVAMLRAAGIPARPVIGVERNKLRERVLVVWAEFYLPDTGWVPFDPIEMKNEGVRTLDVRKPWPAFGTMENLNKRIPLGYHFLPPRSVESPQYPAVWGWDPRPGRAPSAEQQVIIDIDERGKGVEDPQ